MALSWLKDKNPGIQFGRMTIERLGLFSDPSGIPPALKKPNKNLLKQGGYTRHKGKQFTLPGPKVKCGDTSVYFDKTFRRLFVGEVIVRKKNKENREKKYGSFLPVGPSKKHATPGDYYGCFANYTQFQFTLLKKQKKEKEPGIRGPKAFMIQYPGYFWKYPSAFDPRPKKEKKDKVKATQKIIPLVLGHYTKDYFDVNPYFSEKTFKSTYVEPKESKLKKGEKKPISLGVWRPTGPGKKIGGGKFGGFEKYPEAISPLLKKMKKEDKKIAGAHKSKERNYKPQVYGFKTYYTTSVINLNTNFRVNAKNYQHYEPIHVSRYVPKICI